MNKKLKKILLFGCILAVVLATMVMFSQSRTRQGIDFVVSERPIPRWIKVSEFLSRHYHYQQLAQEITKNSAGDEEKLKAIAEWTRKNIHEDYPQGWTIYDDHVLNIIIRGYGTSDQYLDVFTLLCTYAGMPAVMYQAFHPETHRAILLALVSLNGRLVLLDPLRGKYFYNNGDELASIEDIIADHSIVSRVDQPQAIRDKRYDEYFRALTPVKKLRTTRGQLQMPWPRISYEIKRKLGLTEVAILFYGKKPK